MPDIKYAAGFLNYIILYKLYMCTYFLFISERYYKCEQNVNGIFHG